MLNSAFSFIAILMFALFLYANFKIKSGIAPIISLTLIISAVTIASLFNLLLFGVIASYVIVALLTIYTVIRQKRQIFATVKGFFSVGVTLFCVASALMLIFLATAQPLFSEWDEFSFWGTSQKLIYLNDALYTFYDSSLIGNTTPPSLGVLSYYFGAFNAQFYEWTSFFAYDVMFFAICASFTAFFKKDKWYLGAMMFALGFLLPYFFTVYTKAIHVVPVYISAYSDIPLGMMFGASLAVYFFGTKEREENIFWLIPMLFFFTLTKDMGFALSLIVVFIVFFDLVTNVHKKQYKLFFLKGIIAKFCAVIVLALASLAAFLVWAAHMGAVMQVDRFSLGGAQNMGMAQMLITGVLELFSPVKSEKFTTISSYMVSAFFDREISMIGSGLITTCAITVVFLFALIACVKSERIRVLALYLSSLFCFVCYYVFHIFLYVYIFKDNGYALPSYERYIYAYYMGWFMLAVITVIVSTMKSNIFANIKTAALIFGVVGMFSLTSYLLSAENMFLGIDDSSYSLRNTVKEKTALLGDAVQEDDVIYCLSGMNDYGQRWFIYSLEYAQNKIVLETENLHEFEQYSGTEQEKIEAARSYIIEDFKQKGVTNLLIDFSNVLTETYLAQDFDEPTVEYGLTGIAYYEVEYIGDDDIEFHLIKGGQISNE